MEHSKKKRSILPFIIMTVIILALATALCVVFFRYSNYKAESEKTIAAMTDKEAIVEEAIEEEEVIKMADFQEYASQYGVSIEFVQRFFTDRIVYRSGADLVYADIDEGLPKNKLDFSKNLIWEEGKLSYKENGISAAKKGIDVSKHQGAIDWKKVKAAGMEYAIIRLGNRGYTEGNVLLDQNYDKYMKGAIAEDMPVGVYFYSQAITVEEAKEEAAFVLENIKNYDITYPVIFDMEEVPDDAARTNLLTQAEATDITIAFCEEIKAAGYTPMVYGNIKWFMEKVDLTKLTAYDKWFAQYFNTPFFPYELSMWQYTSKGSVDGIKGDVDVNLCFEDYGKVQPEEAVT